MNIIDNPIHFCFIKEQIPTELGGGVLYIAQALEVDICEQADSEMKALCELGRSVVAHIAIAKQFNQEPFQCLRPAPEKYHRIYESRKSEAGIIHISQKVKSADGRTTTLEGYYPNELAHRGSGNQAIA